MSSIRARGSVRSKLFVTIAAAMAIATVATSVAAEKPPRIEVDESFDWTKLHTFDIRIHDSKQREGVMATSVVPKLVLQLETLLLEKGYTIDTENPDFVFSWDAVVADDYSAVSWSGHGEVAKGMLILRATEPSQEDPFWMGADAAGLTGRITPDKAWKKVEPAVRRMLARFPPPPAG